MPTARHSSGRRSYRSSACSSNSACGSAGEGRQRLGQAALGDRPQAAFHSPATAQVAVPNCAQPGALFRPTLMAWPMILRAVMMYSSHSSAR